MREDEEQLQQPPLTRHKTDPAAETPPRSPASLPDLKTSSETHSTPSSSPPRDLNEQHHRSSVNLRDAVHEALAGVYEELPVIMPAIPMSSAAGRDVNRLAGLVSAVQADIFASPEDDEPSNRLHIILTKLETIRRKTRR